MAAIIVNYMKTTINNDWKEDEERGSMKYDKKVIFRQKSTEET